MKLLAATLVGLAVVASPVLAQENKMVPDQKATSITTTHVRTTTRHIHATNVPVRHHEAHHASTRHHHSMHCACPPGHMKAHHMKGHHSMHCSCPPGHMKMHHMHKHHTVKKTETTTKS